MQITGRLGTDAPDPREARLATIAALGFPAAGLVPQRHLEERGEAGHSASLKGRDGGPQVLTEATISRTYLLWRDPEDHDDPVNLADLPAELRATLDAPIEHPIPGWLEEARRMLRYPRLWEAVQTHWTRPREQPVPLADRLITHAEHILTNRFREQLALGDDLTASAPPIPSAAVQQTSVVVDGSPREGLLIDTDPLVVALGCALDDGRLVTVVVPREELPHLVLELVSKAPIG